MTSRSTGCSSVAGVDPASFAVVARGSLPVSVGALGSWDALDDGSHVLALEAEDASGNLARTTLAVSVDTVAPDAPLLTDVSVGASSDELTADLERERRDGRRRLPRAPQ